MNEKDSLFVANYGGKQHSLLDRLGRPFDQSGAVPANLEKPNRAERRTMARELVRMKRQATRERDLRASRTPKPRRPGHPGIRRGVPTFAGAIGPWMSSRLNNLGI